MVIVTDAVTITVDRRDNHNCAGRYAVAFPGLVSRNTELYPHNTALSGTVDPISFAIRKNRKTLRRRLTVATADHSHA